METLDHAIFSCLAPFILPPYAEKSSEYCCDSHDYCNKYLNPINSVRDIEEFTLLTSNDININTNNNNNNQLNNGLTLLIANRWDFTAN